MAIWLGRCGKVDTGACYCEGAPIATGLTGEPASPCARSGKMIVHDNHTRWARRALPVAMHRPPCLRRHEAFDQAYVSRGMNGTKAYRAVYPSIKSDDVAGAAAARLLGNVRVQARIARVGHTPSRDLVRPRLEAANRGLGIFAGSGIEGRLCGKGSPTCWGGASRSAGYRRSASALACLRLQVRRLHRHRRLAA